MATPYSEIYEAFIYKIEGYKLLMLLSEDREEILSKYLKAACRKISNKFKKYVDLTRDDEKQEFEGDIDEDVVDIIAEVMVYEWLKPQMYSNELLESRLNTKDFTEFSSAKLIENIRYVYEMATDAANTAINNYTFRHGDVSELNKP